MADDKIYQEPSEVSVEEGVVSVKGPDAVDVRMTADAADETSHRLLHGALKARGQKLFEQQRSGKMLFGERSGDVPEAEAADGEATDREVTD